MEVKGLARQQLFDVAIKHDLFFENYRALNQTETRHAFRLVPPTSDHPYARRSASERQVKAPCYHAYRDFIRALFDSGATRVTVSLRITSQDAPKASWTSRQAFDNDLGSLFETKVGSSFDPQALGDLCIQHRHLDDPIEDAV